MNGKVHSISTTLQTDNQMESLPWKGILVTRKQSLVRLETLNRNKGRQKVSFADGEKGKALAEIYYVESYKEHNVQVTKTNCNCRLI